MDATSTSSELQVPNGAKLLPGMVFRRCFCVELTTFKENNGFFSQLFISHGYFFIQTDVHRISSATKYIIIHNN